MGGFCDGEAIAGGDIFGVQSFEHYLKLAEADRLAVFSIISTYFLTNAYS